MTETPLGDSLEFTVRVPATVHAGEPVRVHLRLANLSDRTIEVHLQGRETVFDVVVLDASGVEVWRRLSGDPVLAILQLRPLATGDSIEFVATWNQTDRDGRQVPAGGYRVVGELPSDSPTALRSAAALLQVTAARAAAPQG